MSEATAVMVRGAVAFVSLLIFCRILGKQQISQLSFFDYAAGITLGSIAAELTTDLSVPPWPMFVGLATWFALVLLAQHLALANRWLGKLFDGEPVIVVKDGQVLEGNLRRLRLRMSELSSLLRDKGIFDVRQVEYAVLEPRGSLSVLQHARHLPVTPSDLHLPVLDKGMDVELLVDGEVQEQNLHHLGLNRAWLQARLAERHLQPEEVFLLVMDNKGQLYVDKREDRVPPADNLSDYPGPN